LGFKNLENDLSLFLHKPLTVLAPVGNRTKTKQDYEKLGDGRGGGGRVVEE